MIPYEVPLQPQAQSLSISLVGVIYELTLKWNKYSVAWVLDIADNQGSPLVSGIPLVTGTDLLGQYEYLGIGGSLVATTDHDPDAPPTYADLGSTGKLYFITP